MFNRSKIMQDAWVIYRNYHAGQLLGGGTKKFLPKLFAKSLRQSWAEAKKHAAWDKETARTNAKIEAERQKAIAQFANWTPDQRASRIAILQEELRCLPYTNAPIANIEGALKTEITQLSA